jgi:hypothetical protein
MDRLPEAERIPSPKRMNQSPEGAGLPSPKHGKTETFAERVMGRDGTVVTLTGEAFRHYAEVQIGKHNARRRRRHTGPMSMGKWMRNKGKVNME